MLGETVLKAERDEELDLNYFGRRLIYMLGLTDGSCIFIPKAETMHEHHEGNASGNKCGGALHFFNMLWGPWQHEVQGKSFKSRQFVASASTDCKPR